MNIKEFEIYLKEKNKKHIIFDFDETLCTLLIDWTNWIKEMEEVFSQCNVKLSTSESGYSSYAKAQNICIKQRGDEILEINYSNEKEYYSGYDLSPVAIPLLELAKNYAELYIWTSNDKRTVLPILKELNIDKLFKKIIYRNSATYIKPNPEGFNLINERNNPKSEYLLVGDSEADKGAAIESGIDFLNIKEINL